MSDDFGRFDDDDPPKSPFRRTSGTSPFSRSSGGGSPFRRSTASSVSPADFRAVPFMPNDTPMPLALTADRRGILTADALVIRLPISETHSEAQQFNRLTRLLSMLSASVNLSHSALTVYHHQTTGELLVHVVAQMAQDERTAFYDAVAVVVRMPNLIDGALYIGQAPIFVRYRDNGALRGYRVDPYIAPDVHNTWILVDPDQSDVVSLDAYRVADIADHIMQIAPQPSHHVPRLPEEAYIVLPPALYRTLADYMHNHSLDYALANVVNDQHNIILMRISPSATASHRRSTIPAFVMDFLEKLPRVNVLTEAFRQNHQRVLLAWGQDYPLRLDHIVGLLQTDSTYLLMGGDYANTRIDPSPTFVSGDSLMTFHRPQTPLADFQPRDVNDLPQLQMPITLAESDGNITHTSALLLEKQEAEWLKTLLYRQPRDLFEDYLFCEGENLTLLISNRNPIEALPFGLSMRKVGDMPLYIPTNRRFLPDLSWSTLRRTLGIQDDVYTFITDAGRIDLNRDQFIPLTRTLIAHHQQLQIAVQAPQTLPMLKWQPIEITEQQVDDDRSVEVPQWLIHALEERYKTALDQMQQGNQQAVSNRPPSYTAAARELELKESYLEAAVLYELEGNTVDAGRCYDLAYQQTQKKS